MSRPPCWDRTITPDDARELDRLRRDGHDVRATKRGYDIVANLETVRATQLYRTMLHEVGHWVDWLESAGRSIRRGISDAEEDRLRERYFSKTQDDKEAFAHGYADRLRAELEARGAIPFDRILIPESIEGDELRLSDFVLDEERPT